MGLQFAAARAISTISTWGLKNVFHRPAANFPGKVALYVDPHLIGDLRTRLAKGSIAVVGTNGKTTVTNLLADVLEQAGERVVCNRTGANLDSGVATALLHTKRADWGVFETDELWLAKILPQLQANYVVLLNLFRDQLDRVGEIDRIQDSIVGALGTSPETVLVYNADDPLCSIIAERAAALPGRENTRSVAFGVDENMNLAQNSVADAQMCQKCSTMFAYSYHQYGQLGEYRCPNCGFARPTLNYAAKSINLGTDGLSFTLLDSRSASTESESEKTEGAHQHRIHAPFSGAYMVYNLAALAAASHLLGCPDEAVQRAIDEFDPQNGRLQSFEVSGRHILLNLAKNPTGFNQNLKIVAQDEGPKIVAFFVNDKEGDGRDVSWLWDIDFEELAQAGDVLVFAGGLRGGDMQVRLKYAGIPSQVVEGTEDLLDRIAQVSPSTNAYFIANYTALPVVHSVLTARAGSESVGSGALGAPEKPQVKTHRIADKPAQEGTPVVIAHLFPDLLNLYGDGGNVRILEQRLRWRGIPVETRRIHHGEAVNLADADLVFLGGGPDREQRLASAELMRMRDDLRAFVENDGVLLAICGGYQILGHEWLLGDEVVSGLGIIDMTTERASGGSGNRLINNIVLRSPLFERPIVGYENHAGRTHLGAGVSSFGSVVSTVGCGNNDTDACDGVRHRNVVGTYLHGPLLAKNPEVADDLLKRALGHRLARTGAAAFEFEPLDDTAEAAANELVCARLGVR